MHQVLIAGSEEIGSLNQMPLELKELSDFIEFEVGDPHGNRWRMLYLLSSKTSEAGLPVYEYSRHLPL